MSNQGTPSRRLTAYLERGPTDAVLVTGDGETYKGNFWGSHGSTVFESARDDGGADNDAPTMGRVVVTGVVFDEMGRPLEVYGNLHRDEGYRGREKPREQGRREPATAWSGLKD